MSAEEVPIVAALRTQEDEGRIWEEMGALAQEVHPLDLSIGCPDFPIPVGVQQDAKEVAESPDLYVHQYTRAFGHLRLVKALSSLYGHLMGREVDPLTEVIVTNGASEGLYVSFMGLLNPGDEAIIIEPFFDCYEHQVKQAGGTPVFVSLKPRGGSAGSSADWVLDEAELEAAFTDRTKVLIINTPHNPTGKVFSREELEVLAKLCVRRGVMVISDEVYEWMTYDGTNHVRIATLPGMWERTITLGSAGKTFSVTGWKVGWMIGPAHLLAGPRAIHQWSGYLVNTPIQEALARSFERETCLLLSGSADCYFTSIAATFERKRNILVDALKKSDFEPIVPQGGYFIMVNVEQVMSRVDVGGDPHEAKDCRFVKWLSRTWKLQAIPTSVFFSGANKRTGESYIRLCFIKKDENLELAADILQKLKNDLHLKSLK